MACFFFCFSTHKSIGIICKRIISPKFLELEISLMCIKKRRVRGLIPVGPQNSTLHLSDFGEYGSLNSILHVKWSVISNGIQICGYRCSGVCVEEVIQLSINLFFKNFPYISGAKTGLKSSRYCGFLLSKKGLFSPPYLNKNCCHNSWVGGSFISRPWPAVHNMALAIANDKLQTGMQVCSLKLKVRRG